jgi:hypothetical protein
MLFFLDFRHRLSRRKRCISARSCRLSQSYRRISLQSLDPLALIDSVNDLKAEGKAMIRGCSITSRTGSSRQEPAERFAETVAILASIAAVGSIIALVVFAARSIGIS